MVLEFATSLISSLGYLGIFIVILISTSTIFLPLPLYTVEFVLAGSGFNPLLTETSAGLGSALGEFTGYLVGVGGKHVLDKRPGRSKYFTKLRDFFVRYGFFAIVATAFLPFPFDFIGILAGASNYEPKKFFLATLIGKTAKNLLISYAGFFVGTPLFDFIRADIKSSLL